MTLIKRGYNTNNMKVFDTRDEMIASIPTCGKIVELGVFKGEFSKKIIEICKPDELILIDSWFGLSLYSGDVNGNHLNDIREYYTGDELFNITINNLRNYDANIIIIKDTTEVLSTFKDSSFDMIYIDADHSYEGVLEDLKNAYNKIKPGGYIMGHDYEQNMNKTNNVYNFGVKEAVDEFCVEYKQKISMKAMDGCVGYGIKIIK